MLSWSDDPAMIVQTSVLKSFVYVVYLTYLFFNDLLAIVICMLCNHIFYHCDVLLFPSISICVHEYCMVSIKENVKNTFFFLCNQSNA